MTKRHELTDAQWQKIKPLLSPEKPRTGRPNLDHRVLLNGMIWRAKTGTLWRDLAGTVWQVENSVQSLVTLA